MNNFLNKNSETIEFNIIISWLYFNYSHVVVVVVVVYLFINVKRFIDNNYLNINNSQLYFKLPYTLLSQTITLYPLPESLAAYPRKKLVVVKVQNFD